jgi:hypothetical protein
MSNLATVRQDTPRTQIEMHSKLCHSEHLRWLRSGTLPFDEQTSLRLWKTPL